MVAQSQQKRTYCKLSHQDATELAEHLVSLRLGLCPPWRPLTLKHTRHHDVFTADQIHIHVNLVQ